jgi:FtsH-binding integral membrane protein
MLTLSTPQRRFALITMFLSLVFFYFLQQGVEQENWKQILVLVIVYALLMFTNGLWNGYQDNPRTQRIEIGFRYHLLTYLIVNSAALLFAIIPSTTAITVSHALIQILCWGFGLLVHYLVQRKTIKGYSTHELFP